MPVERIDPDLVEFDLRSDEMLVNMGPQHPSTHGVLRLVLRTDGEVVSDLTPNIGYLHRCAEKIGENLPPRQFIPYTDRLDYLAGMNMNLGWTLAVEKLLGFVPPERVRHLRVLVCELDRIASHLVGAGCYGLDLGSFTPFMWCFREREKILLLFEELCGARLTYSYITPGSVTSDLPQGWLKKCETFLTEFEPVIDELHATLTSNSIFIRRTANIGLLTPEMAVDYGCTGPVLRGSGVDWDLRRDGEPVYTRMYEGYKFEVIVQVNGSYPARLPLPGRSARGRAGRLLAPILCPHVGSRAIDEARAARRWRNYSQTGEVLPEPVKMRPKAARRHGLPGDRGPQGPDGLHANQRRHAHAVAGAAPQQQLSAISRSPRSCAAAA